MPHHQRTPVLVICLVVLALNLASAQPAELVYDNSANDLGSNLNPGVLEVGDQVLLGGTERWLSEFTFEYWGFNTVTPNEFSGNVNSRIRFYLNDGPELPGIPGSAVPNTVFYDSGAFEIDPTPRATLTLSDFATEAAVPLARDLPETFTWTVQFSGLGENDSAGVTIYSPPTVGNNFPDYWVNEEGTWNLLADENIDMDFAARFSAIPEPSTIGLFAIGLASILLMGRRRSRNSSGSLARSTQSDSIQTGMKRFTPPLLVAAFTLAASAVAAPSPASTANPSNPHTATLQQVRAAEMPNFAATIVSQAPEGARFEIARDVVLAAADINRASLIPVVGAISKSTPSAAPVAAATAASLQPNLARFIARAAGMAAPEQVGDVIEAVVREVPVSAYDIVSTTGRAVPNSDRDAIEGLRRAAPGWGPFLDEATADMPPAQQDVTTVLIRAVRIMEAQGTSPIRTSSMTTKPAVGPPFQPITEIPFELIPNEKNRVPEGWVRRYSNP
jgi:hypothetical protein